MRAAAALIAALAAACVGWRDRPGATAARGHYYTDNSGIDVATAMVETVQPVSARWSVGGRALVDKITIHRHPLDPGDPGANGQPTGHPDHDPDAVTSASATAGGGSVAEKNRVEGRVRLDGTVGELDGGPVRTWAIARASSEPDYGAVSGVIGGSVELGERNTSIAVELGGGRDRVAPVEAPPGELDAWPATHRRLTASISASQVVARDLVLSAGVALTAQRGRLANPYRRALVRTTLFPEVVPDARDRWTGFLAAAAWLAPGTALHLRIGGYRDSWGVWAAIPELAVVREIGERGLVTTSYRYYLQGRAEFWQARYDNLEMLMSGDPRLGPLRAHVAGVHVGWRLRGDDEAAGAITAELGYQLDVMDFPLYATDLIIGHMATIGIAGAY